MPANAFLFEVVGYLAAACTTLAFLPQAIKAIRTRDTRALSLGMYLLFTTGVMLWLAYAIHIGDGPLIAANGVTLVFVTAILGLKVRNTLFGNDA